MRKTAAVIALSALVFGGLHACNDEEKSGGEKPAGKSESGKQTSGAESGEKPAGKKKFPPKMMAWVLGSKLSLTALGYSRGVDQGVADRMMKKCQIIADALGTKVPPLFKRTGKKAADGAAALNYVLKTAGGPIGKHLRSNHSPAAASLFEIALKSNVLHLLYVGGKTDKLANTIVKVIKDRAKRTALPAKLVDPLLKKIAEGAPPADVRKELRRMHAGVKAHLASSGK